MNFKLLDFKPLTEAQINELLDKSKSHAMTGKQEACKDSKSDYGCSYHSQVLRAEQG